MEHKLCIERGVLKIGFSTAIKVLWSSIEGFTPQPYKPINRISPIGLDLELLSRPPKIPPKVPVAWSPERPSFRAALGPAQQL